MTSRQGLSIQGDQPADPESRSENGWHVTLVRPDPQCDPESDSGLARECYRIRRAVFVDEQGFELENELDEYAAGKDPQSIHLLLSPADAPGEYVGTLRLHLPTLLLGRVAVLKAHRGAGAGRALLVGVESALRGLAGDGDPALDPAADEVVVECHSQVQVRGLYHRLGWEVKGDGAIFDEEGAPHQWLNVDWLLFHYKAFIKKINLRGES